MCAALAAIVDTMSVAEGSRFSFDASTMLVRKDRPEIDDFTPVLGFLAGDIVVMDYGRPSRRGVRQRVETAGAHVWYLPPYSPDLSIRSNSGSRS